MTSSKTRVAIVFPADEKELARTRVEQTRLAATAEALAGAGAEVVSAPYANEIAEEIEARLAGVVVRQSLLDMPERLVQLGIGLLEIVERVIRGDRRRRHRRASRQSYNEPHVFPPRRNVRIFKS